MVCYSGKRTLAQMNVFTIRIVGKMQYVILLIPIPIVYVFVNPVFLTTVPPLPPYRTGALVNAMSLERLISARETPCVRKHRKDMDYVLVQRIPTDHQNVLGNAMSLERLISARETPCVRKRRKDMQYVLVQRIPTDHQNVLGNAMSLEKPISARETPCVSKHSKDTECVLVQRIPTDHQNVLLKVPPQQRNPVET
eukprot:XP_019920112.1 PREDICTED: uncharacterized protein LOC105321464 isoform X1 [Crassostrea gigas]